MAIVSGSGFLPMISIRRLRKVYQVKEGAVAALPNLDLEVKREEFFVLLGPSGSGKSTLLRCIAGIEVPEDGEISIDGRPIYSASNGLFVRPEHRGLGMVFQSYAVWPHMSVFENVALPLTHGVQRIPKASVSDRVMHALSLVQMEEFADRPVPLLSGGQQQRVALARALAVEPLVLLMDEPLSNLDARLREEVRAQMLEITRAVGVTVVYVTHDQTEALALGDRIAVMDRGTILQVGKPVDLFTQPAVPMVADFFGQMNWLNGRVAGPDSVETAIGRLEARTGGLGGDVRIGIRPASIRVSADASRVPNEFTGRVKQAVFLGEQVQLSVQVGTDVILDVKTSMRPDRRWDGETVYCRLDPDDIVLFSND